MKEQDESYKKEYIAAPRDPEEAFILDKKGLELSIVDFWKWNQSDLLENRNRGILAEFIVKTALEIKSTSRLEWDAYDFEIETPERNIKIEVKSAAYIQAWKQNKLSRISFNIAPTKTLLEDGNYSEERKRQADVYIFCLLDTKIQTGINPLNLSLWAFYVVRTDYLDQELGDQGSISLSSLVGLEGVERVGYGELKGKFWEVVDFLLKKD